jgi:hypothetical protein
MTGVIAGMIGGMVTVPGQPTGVSGTSNGETTSTVSWTAPVNNGGSVINGYKVEYATSPYSSYTVFNADTGNANTSIPVTGLTNGESYKFKVTAKNSNGFGTTSEESAVVVTNIVPAAPTIGAMTRGTGTSTVDTLAWTAPTPNGGSAITTYYYRSKFNGSPTVYGPVDLASTSTSKAFDLGYTSLEAVVQIAAVNSLGVGPYSDYCTVGAGGWASVSASVSCACANDTACPCDCGTAAYSGDTSSKTCYKWTRSGNTDTAASYNSDSTDACTASCSACTGGSCGACSGTRTDVTASGTYYEYAGEQAFTYITDGFTGEGYMYMNNDPQGTILHGVNCGGPSNGNYYAYKRYYCSAGGGSYSIVPQGCIDSNFAK